ncbi:MAG: hypothetical protein BWK76_23660 [Desulfobulbaceae bacterium A2]|nr:MAG: hypothetical protein BWK76_23660 [Desulfobulbaceae bacterium A2]
MGVKQVWGSTGMGVNRYGGQVLKYKPVTAMVEAWLVLYTRYGGQVLKYKLVNAMVEAWLVLYA